MLISNLIFTVLALAIPQTLAAPIPVDFDSMGESIQTLVRRTTPAKAPSVITLNGVQVHLESAAGQHGSTAVFHAKYNGQTAYAKQNINDSGFAKEMENTKKASDALHTGLYLASGTAGGSQWLVTKAQPGKPFAILLHEGKFKEAQKAAAITKAVNTVVQAQKALVGGAKIIQADDNTENWLFSDDLSHVYPIDMGRTQAVAAWSTQVEKSQTNHWHEMFEMTWLCFKTPSSPKCKKSSSSKSSKKSRRSI